MITTIRRILQAMDTPIQETLYSTSVNAILDFPITVGDFFKLTKADGKGVSDFSVLNKLYCWVEDKKKNSEYEAVCQELEQISDRLKEIKSSGDISEEGIAL